MTPRRAAVWCGVVVGLVAGWGCAYFNGLYNANRLAGEAGRAARAGRTGEAQALWAQAAAKAESVSARYPDSKYRDDARLLAGRAYRASGRCRRAVVPLAAVADSSPDAALRRQARLLLGACWVELERPDSAIPLLAALVDDADSVRAREARLWRGRARLARGDVRGAVSDLERAGPIAAFDLAGAHLEAQEDAAAARLLGGLTRSHYREERWLPILDALAGHDPEAASELVERLVARQDLTAGQRARLLLADGARWSAAGLRGRALQRLEAVLVVAPDSVEGGVAAARLAIAELEGTDDAAALPALVGRLEAAAKRGGAAAQMAQPYAGLLRQIVQLLAATERPAADVYLFRAAEVLRDSLRAPWPAAAVFRALPDSYAASAVAPKALLAAAALDREHSAELVRRVERDYSASPYARALTGEADAEFRALEDSLRALLAERGEEARPLRGRPGEEPAERVLRPRRP